VARNRVRRLGEGGLALLAAAACILALAGCGLETTIYYDKPTFINNGSSFILTHNTANTDSSFHGYELYYRVYDDSSKAATDLAFINSMQDTSSYSPITAFSSLTGSRGFVRLRDVDNNDFPLFPIAVPSVATKFIILPDNSSTSVNWSYTTDPVTTETELLRYNGDSFNSVYATGDTDFSGTTVQLGNTVYIVMFAVAYGFDFSSTSSTTIYSFPVAADVLTYTTPN
jgi:hypothetical protein